MTDGVVLLDFQVIGQSMPVGDLAYFVTGSLSPATASEIEQSLYERWLSAPRIGGGRPSRSSTGCGTSTGAQCCSACV